MLNPTLRRSGPAALVAMLAALIIGCGGGGGGGGKSGSSSGTTPTTAGAGTGDAGTIGGGTDGGAGNLLPNTVYYLVGNGDTYDVRFANESGASGIYATGVSATNSAATPDPSATGRVVFAAEDTNGSVGIYRNTTVSLTGATVVVAPQYGEVLTVQVSRDGTRVVYVAAASNTADPHLYTATVGGAPVLLDDGYILNAELGSDGTNVVYEELPSSGDTEVFVRDVAAANPVQITNDDVDNQDPQFSKDGKKVVFAYEASAGRTILGTVGAVGGTITRIDPFPGTTTNLRAPSFNGAGSRIAFRAEAESAAASGVYTCDLNGGNVSKVASGDPLPLTSIFWTNANGRSPGRTTFHLNLPSKK